MFPSAVKEIADVASYIARLLTVDVTHSIFTARKRSLEQGNVFTGVSVCQSTGGGRRGLHPEGVFLRGRGPAPEGVVHVFM